MLPQVSGEVPAKFASAWVWKSGRRVGGRHFAAEIAKLLSWIEGTAVLTLWHKQALGLSSLYLAESEIIVRKQWEYMALSAAVEQNHPSHG